MKKQLLSIMALITTGLAFGQTIPNGGFEQWQSYNYENPQYFQTSNYNSESGSMVSSVNAYKTTQAYHGQYAVLLETVTNYNYAAGILDTNFGFIANGNPGGNNAASNGIPISQKPTGVRFYYEYYSAYSNNSPTATPDSGLAIFEFKKQGVFIGAYQCRLVPTGAPGYVLFNQTFSLSATPDTVLVAFASSSDVINNGKGQPGSSLYIDSIRFTGISAQPAMLNGDLENWTPQTVDIISGWNQSQNYTRTTDKYSGNYAIQLTTMQPVMSGLNSGQVSSANSNGNGGPQGGTPYTNTKDTLVFYYKYYPANYPSSTDTASAWINLKGTGNQQYDAGKNLTYSNVYKKVEIPFDLTTIPQPFTPDTMILSFQSSKNYPIQSAYNGSVLYIDEVYLKSQKIPVSYFGGILNPDGCVGDTIKLNDLSSNAPNNWQWFMTGAHPAATSTQQDPKIVYTSPGTYSISLQACDSFGCGSFFTRTIHIHALPQIQASAAAICANTSATLTVNNTLLTADSAGASPYFWSDATGIIANGTRVVLTPTATTSYTVLGTSQYGCNNTATTSITLLQAPIPDICMVTVDSLSQNNIVYWDKTVYNNVDSFIVYRQVNSNVYNRIGAQPYSALSQFIDTVRSVGGTNNGDPNGGSYRYKLQTVDTCGNYSALGPYHNTVYIQHNSSGVFTWATPYSIENQSSPVTNYVLFCDTANTNTWTAIQSVAGNQQQVADPGYANHSSIANWRVDATGFNCNPTFKLANGNNSTMTVRVKSHSNQNNNRVSGINKLTNTTQVTVFPNPATNILNIGFAISTNKASVKITSLLGSEVYSNTQLSGSNLSIDISSLASGTYLVQISTDNLSEIKKIVKQ